MKRMPVGTRSNASEQLNGINSRVAAAYGVTAVYILLATVISHSIEDMTIWAILAAGGMLLLIRAVRIDLASRYEADNVHEQQRFSRTSNNENADLRDSLLNNNRKSRLSTACWRNTGPKAKSSKNEALRGFNASDRRTYACKAILVNTSMMAVACATLARVQANGTGSHLPKNRHDWHSR